MILRTSVVDVNREGMYAKNDCLGGILLGHRWLISIKKVCMFKMTVYRVSFWDIHLRTVGHFSGFVCIIRDHQCAINACNVRPTLVMVEKLQV